MRRTIATICSANSNEPILLAMRTTAAATRTSMAATSSERAETAAGRRVRKRTRRTLPARVERAADAKVDLDCLPRLLGFNLRRAHQCAWRQYVAVIGESDIRPGLFSLLVLVGANPGIAQIELGTHLGIDKASIVALLDRLEKA